MNRDSGVWALCGMYQVGIRHRVIVTRSQVICHQDMYRRFHRGWLSIYRATPICGGRTFFQIQISNLRDDWHLCLGDVFFFFFVIANNEWEGGY